MAWAVWIIKPTRNRNDEGPDFLPGLFSSRGQTNAHDFSDFLRQTLKVSKMSPASKRQDPVTALRLTAELRKCVEVWAAKQADKPGRSEAIRRLIEKGLASDQKAGSPSNRDASKASKMAGKEIDRRADQSVPVAEQQSRKRRLLKGPKEFRDIRKDHPTKKG